MSRSTRLLALMQALRRRRRAVSAAVLGEELGVSLRTIYRDIATLVEQGAVVEGAAGLGYVLKTGTFLPPLMFNEEEVDALILGLQLVEQRGDDDLGAAARNALAKIEAVLPPALENAVGASGLLAGPTKSGHAPTIAVLRQAMRDEQKLALRYVDKTAKASQRIVWPVAIGFFEAAEVLAAWCETRRDFRHFRLDRIAAAQPTGERYPRRRRILLAEWRLQQEVAG